MEFRLDLQSNHIEKENGESPKIFKEIISTLPRRKGWDDSVNDLFQYQGFWYYSIFLEGIVSAQQQFHSQPSDIIVCSAPKTGTTWLKSLTFAIMTRTSFDDSTSPLLSKMPHDCVPFLELDLAHSSSNRDPEIIPLLATHIPYSSLPRSIIDSGCKIVYICRNPKDAFVSYYHFVARRLAFKNIEPLPIDEAFELYCKGVSFYGPYWDHVLEFWTASLERPDKILFLKYEEMREDTVLHVKKLAEFIGYPFSSEEKEKGLVEKIVKMCSFESLSNLEVNKSGKHRDGTTVVIENKIYFRKGKIGDWQNYLTPEMAARLDLITAKKLSGSGLTL